MTEILQYRGSPDRTVSNYRRLEAVPLLVGFLALTAAVVAAHRSSAAGYELSLYTATPGLFWAGTALAMGCAMVVALGGSGWPRRCAVLLATESCLAVVGLPILRGYAYFTSGDALTHLGWVRDLLTGALAPSDIVYPGVHVVSIHLHRLLGLDPGHATQLAVVCFAGVFVAFVPLVVAVLTESRAAPAVAVFAAVMVLPINNVSVHLAVFPSTVAIFFVPYLLLLAVVAFTHSSGRLLGPVDALVALGSVSIVLLHPQQAVNLLLVFGTATVAGFVYRRRSGDQRIYPLVGHTAFLTAVSAVWNLSHDRITVTAGDYVAAVTSVLTGEVAAGGETIGQRTGSLAALGATPLEIGLKLFLPGAVFALLTVVLVFGGLRATVGGNRDRAPVTLVGLGLVPVGVVLTLYVVGQLQSISFRHLGFMMALATVFGAVVLGRWIEWASRRTDRGAGTALAGVVLAGLVVLSAATLFPSPFIYQPNGQITEMRLDGYGTAFAHENDDVAYVGIRSGVDRYRDALEGTGTGSLDLGDDATERVPYGQLDGDLTAVFDGPRYLVVTRADIQRETVVWGELRYSERGLRTVGQSPGVDRVVANGEFSLYYVSE